MSWACSTLLPDRRTPVSTSAWPERAGSAAASSRGISAPVDLERPLIGEHRL